MIKKTYLTSIIQIIATLFLLSLLGCEVEQAVEDDSLVSVDDETTLYANGEELYNVHCSTCHGPLSSSQKRNATAEQISAALSNVSQMQNLTLTEAEIKAIAYALGNQNPDQTIPKYEDLYSVLVRLTNREFLKSLGSILSLTQSAQAELEKLEILADETPDLGLVSSAERQQLTQIAFGRFIAAAEAAVNLKVNHNYSEPANESNFDSRFGCDNQENGSSESCLYTIGKQMMETGFRGKYTANDQQLLESLIAELNSINERELSENEANGNVSDETLKLSQLYRNYAAVVQLISLSPKFSLHIEYGEEIESSKTERALTEIEIANKLAYFISGSPPDDLLLSAAKAKKLISPDERAAHVKRLISSAESRLGVEDIIANWLQLNPKLTSDQAIAETRTFLREWIQNKQPFADIYTAMVPVAKEESNQEKVSEPFGIFGLSAVLASNTNDAVPSFINRGEFVTKNLLCATLPTDLPDDATNKDFDSDLEVFEYHGSQPCATCHEVFDDYGAALHQFNPSGTLYLSDNQLGVSFNLYQIGDVSGSVSNPAELGLVIGESRQAHHCFTSLWYRHATRRDLLPEEYSSDEAIIEEILSDWIASDRSVEALLTLIASHESFIKLYH